MNRLVDCALCLAVGAGCGVIAWAIIGERQPAYLMIAAAAGMIITDGLLSRSRPR